ncbi:uncharacterized protein DSM5745_00054 [Aspergillus mulundensis]|uniref:Uncharacterized protein n=1 Tax=Aspergillus mulundensis TaxID=1810919 RepID=A0A3D8T2D8_9EURO|nr:hypothetical protein DSM5745_00054 [Aspergillus mulundensis]RDW92732.1 hypothetical protein DSM5745_00054 [Aspergillus mulundensis]
MTSVTGTADAGIQEDLGFQDLTLHGQSAAEPRVIRIAPDFNLRIQVSEYESAIGADGKDHSIVSRSAIFEVDRQKLDASEHLSRKLFGELREGSLDANVAAMEILFHYLHDSLESVTADAVSIETIYHLINMCDKYKVSGSEVFKVKAEELKGWFVNWYNVAKGLPKNRYRSHDFYRSMLFPCYAFDHAQGFLETSRFVIYNTVGHIEERNPTTLHRLHLPSRVIQQLNAARGRLKTLLVDGLINDISDLLDEDCECKEDTFFHMASGKELETLHHHPAARSPPELLRQAHQSSEPCSSEKRGWKLGIGQ